MVAEPESSTPLIPKPATGHDPEPVPFTSHPHTLRPYVSLFVILATHLIFILPSFFFQEFFP
jgi:hypothetical protein